MQFDYRPQETEQPLELNINLDANLSLEHLTIIEAGLLSSLESVRQRMKELEEVRENSQI